MSESDDITIEEVRHLALLTRINMTDHEIEEMRDQMSDILASIEVLSEVDTDGIEPTGHSVDVHSVMREDISSDSITLEDALANAP
ncbi:MAG: Asp-tRNA(Asn)/Glu-tRNA(Gln) amidotransferase subunit GatC, partial [Chloroflexota bacterium]|nr:Asp-tRNA(Asn)/Glu-tRNA(Gln) amidotransferase subunit GatC [Chloroflexota bacterium]